MGILEGRVAIITGSNKGIGKQVAFKFAEEGATVVLASIDTPPYMLKDVADTIAAKGGKVLAIHCDQEFEDQIKNVVETTIATFGKIDILVNNAQGGQHIMDTFETMTAENAIYLYKTGPLAYALFIKYCLPYMKERQYGRIINFGSGASMGAEPNVLSFGMAKGAVTALTRVAAYDIGQFNIILNTILPSAYTGESLSPHAARHKAIREEAAKRIPCRYVGKPYEDIAPVCVFLASEGCRYMQGQTIAVDGGGIMST